MTVQEIVHDLYQAIFVDFKWTKVSQQYKTFTATYVDQTNVVISGFVDSNDVFSTFFRLHYIKFVQTTSTQFEIQVFLGSDSKVMEDAINFAIHNYNSEVYRKVVLACKTIPRWVERGIINRVLIVDSVKQKTMVVRSLSSTCNTGNHAKYAAKNLSIKLKFVDSVSWFDHVANWSADLYEIGHADEIYDTIHFCEETET